MARINRNLTRDRIQASALTFLIWLLKRLPYDLRRRIAGGLAAQAVSRIPALRRRIIRNLDYVLPDLDQGRRRQLVRDVGTSFGQTMIETYSAAEFRRSHSRFIVSGAGLDALNAAKSTGKGAVLVSGHFGQWEAVRAALFDLGLETGAVYRPNNNIFYDIGFLSAIRQMGEPILPNTPAGTRAMIRHVGNGGRIAMLIDQHIGGMPMLNFFGKPARTAIFAAELALKFDLPLIACYGIRRPAGRLIDVVLEAPVPRADALTMTQHLNDSLEARIREHPGQWYWLHQRWKPKRARANQG